MFLTALLSWLAGLRGAALVLSSDGNSFPPPLGRAEETECFRRLREDGDAEARGRLIEHNLRLVAHVVRKYYASSRDEEDLISIGTVGLIKSVDSFNPANGARFATYAARCIQNEILMYFRSRRKLQMEVSMEETIETDREGNALTYEDVVAVEDTIADDLDARMKAQKALDYVTRELEPRERQIIVMRYGLNGRKPATQRETAGKLGISRSYVSRLEKAALEKLRRLF